MKNEQKGFTLLELVVVILILGILAALAIPKFLSLEREARIAVLQSVQSVLKSGSNLVYAKAAAAGVHTANNQDIAITATETIRADYGYPEPDRADIELLFDDLKRISFEEPNGTTVDLRLDGIATCSVRYQAPAAAGQRPTISIDDSGC